MRWQSLDDMCRQLLFHNSMDVWRALCRERGWDWRNGRRYQDFIAHLKQRSIPLARITIQHALRKLREIDQVETYTVRLDDKALRIIRAFGAQ